MEQKFFFSLNIAVWIIIKTNLRFIFGVKLNREKVVLLHNN